MVHLLIPEIIQARLPPKTTRELNQVANPLQYLENSLISGGGTLGGGRLTSHDFWEQVSSVRFKLKC